MMGHLQFRFGLLFLIFYMNIGSAANYDPPYANSEHHDAMNIYSTMYQQQQQQQQQQQRRHNEAQIEQNLQGNSNYQQLYRYYYTPPSYHQQQQQIAPTQLWSGPPIVVEDNAANHHTPATVNQPTVRTGKFYTQQQHDTPTNIEDKLSLARHRNSYTQATPQLNYKNYHTNYNYNNNNNNNNNIVYHRDFRPQIAIIPDADDEHVQQQDDNITWHERQHSQMEEAYRKQYRNEQQQQQQQYYATNTNLHSNGISNDLRKKSDLSDYSEHFRRYLENNPHRIKPIY